jgi:hypothetical protein
VFRMKIAWLATVVTTAMLAVMLLSVGGAVAKTPAGWGLTAVGIVDQIGPGATQGYTVTVSNTGPSSISKLYLTTLDTSRSVAGTPISPAYSELEGCDTGVDQGCSLGAFPVGRTLSFTLAYTAAAGDAPFKVKFSINTSGFVLGTNSSHGDSLPFPTSTTVNSSNDFAGGWTLGTDALVTTGTLGRNNVQNTTVSPPDVHIPVTVDDTGNTTFDCSASQNCTNAFGVWTKLNVNNDADYQGSPFEVTLLLYGKSIPNGVQLSDIKVIHVLENPAGTETLTQTDNACPSDPSTTTADCIASVTKAGQNVEIVLWLIKNGGLRGSY